MAQDGRNNLAKVGVAGSNPVVRSTPDLQERVGIPGRGVCHGLLPVPCVCSPGADGADIRPGGRVWRPAGPRCGPVGQVPDNPAPTRASLRAPPTVPARRARVSPSVGTMLAHREEGA